MNMSPQVSVAMCTYNGERWLGEQLHSIARQTQPPGELVICDDGSSDGTERIIHDFASSAPFPVRYTRNARNLGSTANFEQAISLCTGDLIALSDQDDIWYPHKLQTLTALFASDPLTGCVFSDADLIDDNSVPTGVRLWESFGFSESDQKHFAEEAIRLLCRREFITGATMMFRSSLRDAILSIPRSWVHDAWIAWMVALHARLAFTPERLIGYRVHSAQQAGVPPRGLRERLQRLAFSERDACVRKAGRFDDLRGRCHSPAALAHIDETIRLCRSRANLPAGLVGRAAFVLSNIDSYRRYTNGRRTMLRDLLQNAGTEGICGEGTQP